MPFDPRQFSEAELSEIIPHLNESELQTLDAHYESQAGLASQFGTSAFRSTRKMAGGYPGMLEMAGDWFKTQAGKPLNAVEKVMQTLGPALPTYAGTVAKQLASTMTPEMGAAVSEPLKKVGKTAREFITQPIAGLEPKKYEFKDRPFMELARITGGLVPSVVGTYGGASALKAAGMAPKAAALLSGVMTQFPSQATDSYNEQLAKGIDPEVALVRATGEAGLISLLESLPASQWLEGYGGTNRLIKLLKGGITEGSEEVVQASVSLMRRLADARTPEETDEALMQFSQEAKEGFTGGLLLGSGAGAISPASRVELREQVRKEISRATEEVDFFGTKKQVRKFYDEQIRIAQDYLYPLDEDAATEVVQRTLFNLPDNPDQAGLVKVQTDLMAKSKELLPENIREDKEYAALTNDPGTIDLFNKITQSVIDGNTSADQAVKWFASAIEAKHREFTANIARMTPRQQIDAMMKDTSEGKYIRTRYVAAYRDEATGKLKDLTTTDELVQVAVDMQKRIEAGETLPHKRVQWLLYNANRPFDANGPYGFHFYTDSVRRLFHISQINEDGKLVEDIVVPLEQIRGAKTLRTVINRSRSRGSYEALYGNFLDTPIDLDNSDSVIVVNRYSKPGQILKGMNMMSSKWEYIMYLRSHLTGESRDLLNQVLADKDVQDMLKNDYYRLSSTVGNAKLMTGENMASFLRNLNGAHENKWYGQLGPILEEANRMSGQSRRFRGSVSDLYETIVHELGHAYGTNDQTAAQTAMATKMRKYKFAPASRTYLGKNSYTHFLVNMVDPSGNLMMWELLTGRQILDLETKGYRVDELFVGKKGNATRAMANRPTELKKIPLQFQEESGQLLLPFGESSGPQAPGSEAPSPGRGVQANVGGEGTFVPSGEQPIQETTVGQDLPTPPGGRQGPGKKRIPMNFNPFDIEHVQYINGVFKWGANNGRDFESLWKEFIGPEFRTNPLLKNFLGVYYSKILPNGRIVIKDMRDIMNIAHETGHFVEDYFDKSRGLLKIPRSWTSPIRQELVRVSSIMRGPFEQTDGYRNSRGELFADFFAMHVLDEAQARNLAPEFYKTVIDPLMSDNPEFAYVASKLRELQTQMKPIVEFVDALKSVPQFYSGQIRDATQTNQGFGLLEALGYTKARRIKFYDWFKTKFDELLNINKFTKWFSEKGGLTDAEFEVLRQYRKLVAGGVAHIQEEITDPLGKLDAKDQQIVAETLQEWNKRYSKDADHPLAHITEKTRTELARWALALRKIGILNDMTFWNHVGRYFPYFYKEHELKAHEANVYTNKIKSTIKANTKFLKQRMTNVEFGMEGYNYLFREAPLKLAKTLYQLWPERYDSLADIVEKDETEITDSAVQAILTQIELDQTLSGDRLSKADFELMGMQMRDDMGLIKVAAYPVHKRLSQMIKTYYKVQMMNAMANVPGVVLAKKSTPGAKHIGKSKLNGALSNQYVRGDVYDMLMQFDQNIDPMVEKILQLNAFWKTVKVPMNIGSYITNNVTNLLMMWLNDIPVFTNPMILVNGIRNFNKNSPVYKALRDKGLYHHNYGEEELLALATLAEQHKNDGHQLYAKALELMSKPGRFYGVLEDMGKTVIATFYMNKGYSTEEAIRAADKILFDYSSVSQMVKFGKGTFLPFFTWSAKVAPRLVENAILRPEKFMTMWAVLAVLNAMLKAANGVDDEEEKRTKPDNMRGRPTLVIGRDARGNPIYINLDKYMPWGTWTTKDLQGLPVPQALTAGGLPFAFLGALMFGKDSMGRNITEDWMTPGQKREKLAEFVGQQMLPQWLGEGGQRFLDSVRGIERRPGDEPESPGFGFAKGILGVPLGGTTAITRDKSSTWAARMLSEGVSNLEKRRARGAISQAEYEREYRKLYNHYRAYITEHNLSPSE